MAQQNSKKKTKNQIQWKSSPYKRTKEEAAVFTVLLLSAFLYGGFYEFSGAMLAAVLGILLIVCRVKYSFQIKGKKQLAVLLSVFLVRYYLFLCNRSGNGFCGRDQNAATASWLSVFHAVFG